MYVLTLDQIKNSLNFADKVKFPASDIILNDNRAQKMCSETKMFLFPSVFSDLAVKQKQFFAHVFWHCAYSINVNVLICFSSI